jgi:hypothetical protein
MNSNGFDELVWKACSTFSGQRQEETYYKTSYKLGEATKYGRILGQVRGQKILIDQLLIHEQFRISKEKTIYAANATFEEAKNRFKKKCRSTCLC